MIYHVVKDKNDPGFCDCWDVVDEQGRSYLINRLYEIRVTGVILHRGYVKDKLPKIYSFIANIDGWSSYWFEKED